MTNVKFQRAELEKAIGTKITADVEAKISLFGTPLEMINDEEVEVEVFPNRPDLISLQGFARGFRAFLGRDTGLKEYKLAKPAKDYTVKVDASVNDVRPFTACAIVRDLKFDDAKIKSLIELQEKLHFTVGRDRKKLAIGVYPLEKIQLPIAFKALAPEKVRFVPLEMEREMNGREILTKHPTGRDYAHLLEGKEKFPVFVDATGKVLSMPPIINSHETGKVSENTRDVFVECSGFHLETLQKTLNIIVTTLAEMGGKVYQMNVEYGSKKVVTPNLTPENMKLSLERTNKLLGLDLKEKDLEKLLPRMGYEYKNKMVRVPAWRTDILHEVDIIEDVAIAYGYNKLTPEIPQIATVAAESERSKMKQKLAELLVGLGLLEISTYHLIKVEEAERVKSEKKVAVAESKTEYKFLRPSLLVPALRILSENKDNDYPQEMFEIGTAFLPDSSGETETGVREDERVLIVSSPANFTRIKQMFNYVVDGFGVKAELREGEHASLIDGRVARVFVGGREIGYFGEVSPDTLRAWGIKMPVAVCELSLNGIFEELAK